VEDETEIRGTRSRRPSGLLKDIRRATRKQYSAEEKIRIVLDGLRGEHSIAEAGAGREGPLSRGLYYNWSKEFLEAGKRRLARGIQHERRPASEVKGPYDRKPRR